MCVSHGICKGSVLQAPDAVAGTYPGYRGGKWQMTRAESDSGPYNNIPRLQLLVIDEANDGQEDGVPRGRLDDGALALALRVQVNVATLLLLALFRLNVQQLCGARRKGVCVVVV